MERRELKECKKSELKNKINEKQSLIASNWVGVCQREILYEEIKILYEEIKIIEKSK